MEEYFEVKIPLFEGPFDLLLFFIKRDELDIHDIPISKITKDFLDYLHQLKKMNIEVASEFILVASTLMRIKAKMLLPRVENDEDGNEIDPREELVKHLLEYKKYKSVVGQLADWEEKMLKHEKRGNMIKELKSLASVNNVETELQDIDLYKLLKVFRKTLKRFENQQQERPRHQVTPYPYKVEEQKTLILGKLAFQEKLSFEELINEDRNKIAVIFNFLSILELLAISKITINLGLGYNNFWISKNEETSQNTDPVSPAQA
ncbi:MAG: segregation/condensation protein A [Flammeovirgaceae bacterium]|nr:segregation/condensation protein A [Flammeovirgaceae bacterium]